MHWLLLVLMTGPALAADGPPLAVPAGPAPTLDGSLDDAAWAGAARVPLHPEGEAFLVRDGSALYVGLRVPGRGLPSLALARERTIRVLHASASLGTAVYEPNDGRWTASRTFAWQCRDGQTEEGERERFLEAEGWLATTMAMGTGGEAEYRLAAELWQGAHTRLALVVCQLAAGPPTPCVWPARVADGTTDRTLLFGTCPDLRFAPDTWGRLATPSVQETLDRLEASVPRDPAGAYVQLLDLLAAHPEAAGEAQELRQQLEVLPAVRPEAEAQRDLEAVLDWLHGDEVQPELAREKLQAVATRHPGTRAARVAGEHGERLDR
jgi:hypothetical protein